MNYIAISGHNSHIVAMKFSVLMERLKGDSIFSSAFLLAGQSSPANMRRQIDRWVKSGKVYRLRRGVYTVAPPFAQSAPHPFAVANALRRASYVSLQSALAHYGMIPEFTPVTTSVTTGRPEEIDTPMGRFAFRHVQRSLFFGVCDVNLAPGQTARMATPEKALVDLLYLTSASDDPAYLEELRLEPGSRLDRKRLRVVAEQCGSAKVLRAVRSLEGLWEEQGAGYSL